MDRVRDENDLKFSFFCLFIFLSPFHIRINELVVYVKMKNQLHSFIIVFQNQYYFQI
jgi:hypothetical protein